ncbi:hypothetical protein [Nocardia brevicatena]|uniref:hypothetical protein n=1 Tax=Nocardia brevicatena TaxID=37327 RepID=UPI0012FC4439
MGIDNSTQLRRHRWKIERPLAWLAGYRRLVIRYECHRHLFAAFVDLAAELICYQKIPT